MGKTSADIHMVLDIVDFLAGPTVFDEFIIMSADADFTPVLLKLRKHDRRTIVLAIGPSSSSYTSACDLVVDQDAFVDFLLPEPADVPGATAVESSPSEEGTPPTEEATAARRSSRDAFLQNRREISIGVQEVVARSASAVPLAALAAEIRKRFPDIAEDWGGYRNFSAMLDNLDISMLTRVNKMPGYIYDAARHVFQDTRPVENEPSEGQNVYAFADRAPLEECAADDPALRDLARRVSDLTDTPFLSPASYAELFAILAEEINTNGYQITRVSKAVRDECQRRGRHISRQFVNFVMQGISYAGHRFGVAPERPEELAKVFFRNAINLCVRSQLYLTEDELELMRRWLVGEDVALPDNDAGQPDSTLPAAED